MSKTQDHIDNMNKYGAMNYESLPVVMERGEDVFMWDVEGKKYYDVLSAYSAVNQGHCHPRIVIASNNQVGKLALTSRACHTDKADPFLKKLSEITGKDRVLTMNSGAEAVETAIKMARKWGYEKKNIDYNYEDAEIAVCENNFHGRTTTIVGFSSDPVAYTGFYPETPGFYAVAFNDSVELENSLSSNFCAFLVEPIQGEAGVIVPDADYLKKVREICTRNNILMMCDEIQTGLGRTGKMFCYQHAGIEPDVVIMGKALSGGAYPISAVAANEDIIDVFTAGTHGSTYGGNPLASAIGLEALNVIEDEKLCENSERMGRYFKSELESMLKIRKGIKEVRGKGLLIAVEYDSPVAHDKCLELLKQKPVGVFAKDTHNTTIRFAPPLTITKQHIDDILDILDNVL